MSSVGGDDYHPDPARGADEVEFASIDRCASPVVISNQRLTFGVFDDCRVVRGRLLGSYLTLNGDASGRTLPRVTTFAIQRAVEFGGNVGTFLR